MAVALLSCVDGTETRSYNGFGQLISASSTESGSTPSAFAYRPDGLRYSKTVGSGSAAATHIHLWDGQNIVAEVGATGALNTRYIRGAGLVAREVDRALQYYLFDAHGDVLHRLDASGNMLRTYRYDAFGNEIDPEPLDTNPFRYCGEYFDREIGTYYLRARNYDPRIGRFTTEDPARKDLNYYVYGRNNPIGFIDPTGTTSSPYNYNEIAGRESQKYMRNYFGTMADPDNWKSFLKSKGDQLVSGIKSIGDSVGSGISSAKNWWNKNFGGVLGFKASHQIEQGRFNDPLYPIAFTNYVKTSYSEDDPSSLITFESTTNDANLMSSSQSLSLNFGSFSVSANLSVLTLGASIGITNPDGTSTSFSLGISENQRIYANVAQATPRGGNHVISQVSELSVSPFFPIALAFGYAGNTSASPVPIYR